MPCRLLLRVALLYSLALIASLLQHHGALTHGPKSSRTDDSGPPFFEVNRAKITVTLNLNAFPNASIKCRIFRAVLALDFHDCTSLAFIHHI